MPACWPHTRRNRGNLLIGVHINDSAHGWATRIERVALKQNVPHRGHPGFKRHEVVRLDVKFLVGMHAPGNVERLATTDFHVARGIHRKLENGNARQLYLLINAASDVLDAGGVPGAGVLAQGIDFRGAGFRVRDGAVDGQIGSVAPASCLAAARKRVLLVTSFFLAPS